MKKLVQDKLKELHKDITIHDFRMVTGNTHSNLIFDMVAPYEMQEENDVIKKMIEDKVKELDETYCTVVHIDRSYVNYR